MEIPITLMADEKGYLDRECPNENCLFTFKINIPAIDANIISYSHRSTVGK
jgi:hypothetical protein